MGVTLSQEEVLSMGQGLVQALPRMSSVNETPIRYLQSAARVKGLDQLGSVSANLSRPIRPAIALCEFTNAGAYQREGRQDMELQSLPASNNTGTGNQERVDTRRAAVDAGAGCQCSQKHLPGMGN